MRTNLTTQELFERKHRRYRGTECWLWTAATTAKGYGDFQGKHAHRVAWELYRGPIPAGLLVCHHCDVPDCVNPDHLFLGTNLDNSRDKIAKGRMDRRDGTHNGNSKLTEAQARRIRADTRANKVIAAEYGVTSSMVGYIKRGDHWRST